MSLDSIECRLQTLELALRDGRFDVAGDESRAIHALLETGAAAGTLSASSLRALQVVLMGLREDAQRGRSALAADLRQRRERGQQVRRYQEVLPA